MEAKTTEPQIITWAMTRSNSGVRHVVNEQDDIPPTEAGKRTLCGAGAWYTTSSKKLETWSPWWLAVPCRRCDTRATALGMVTAEATEAR